MRSEHHAMKLIRVFSFFSRPKSSVLTPELPVKSITTVIDQSANTARSRFYAASRLQAHDKSIIRTTGFASAYLVALTGLPYFIRVPERIEDYLNLISMGMSVIILTYSLLQYSSQDLVISEQHHRCALEINEIRRAILLKSLPSKLDLEKFTEKYSFILQKYSVNHEEIDFIKVQLDRPHEFPWMKRSTSAYYSIRAFYSAISGNITLIVITLFMLWVLLGLALPNQLPG
jgi:hypothetical protein